MNTGRPQKQAVAIALKTAGKSKYESVQDRMVSLLAEMEAPSKRFPPGTTPQQKHMQFLKDLIYKYLSKAGTKKRLQETFHGGGGPIVLSGWMQRYRDASQAAIARKNDQGGYGYNPYFKSKLGKLYHRKRILSPDWAPKVGVAIPND